MTTFCSTFAETLRPLSCTSGTFLTRFFSFLFSQLGQEVGHGRLHAYGEELAQHVWNSHFGELPTRLTSVSHGDSHASHYSRCTLSFPSTNPSPRSLLKKTKYEKGQKIMKCCVGFGVLIWLFASVGVLRVRPRDTDKFGRSPRDTAQCPLCLQSCAFAVVLKGFRRAVVHVLSLILLMV